MTQTTPDWQFYLKGVLVVYPETASMVINQLWGEIDRMKKENQ